MARDYERPVRQVKDAHEDVISVESFHKRAVYETEDACRSVRGQCGKNNETVMDGFSLYNEAQLCLC